MIKKKSFKERVEEYKEQLPDHPKAEQAFNELLSMGKSPRVVLSAIDYATNDKSQAETAKEHNATEPSLRECLDLVFYIMDIEKQDAYGKCSTGGENVIDYIKEISGLVGLEEGSDYTNRNPGPVTIKKSGFRKIRDFIIEKHGVDTQ